MNNGFALTTLFVVPDGTLASSGSTQDLTSEQLGIFRPDYSIATAGNIAAAKYFYIAQGRKENVPGLGSKRSAKISSKAIVEWYKSTGEDTARTQITEISNITAKCGDDLIFTFRVHSNDTDVAFYNGYTKSVVVKAPCCDCGTVPCADIAAADVQALVDDAVAKLNAVGPDSWNGTDVRLSTFLTFYRSGSGATSKLVAAAKAVPSPSSTGSADIQKNMYEPNRMWFRAFVTKGTDTTADFYAADRCDNLAVVTITQRASFAQGSAEELKLLEKRYYSYQTSHFKHLHRNPDWNGAFASSVVDGKTYDLYYIVFKNYDGLTGWSDTISEEQMVIVAFESTEGSAFETVLTAALGAPDNKSVTDISTTTTTSTSTTSTTSTTGPVTIP